MASDWMEAVMNGERVCTACGKRDVSLLQLPLGNYVCEDEGECIAQFSGWNEPVQAEEKGA